MLLFLQPLEPQFSRAEIITQVTYFSLCNSQTPFSGTEKEQGCCFQDLVLGTPLESRWDTYPCV